MIVIRYNDSNNFVGISICTYFIYFLSLIRIIPIEPVTIKYLREINRMYKWYCVWDFIGYIYKTIQRASEMSAFHFQHQYY